jgi:hypothetical protein
MVVPRSVMTVTKRLEITVKREMTAAELEAPTRAAVGRGEQVMWHGVRGATKVMREAATRLEADGLEGFWFSTELERSRIMIWTPAGAPIVTQGFFVPTSGRD